jgi:threonine dehydrogenase-like Zn-dependent dehydrogenase
MNPKDAILKVTSMLTCDSDLHLYDGKIPSVEKADVLGHEPNVLGFVLTLQYFQSK